MTNKETTIPFSGFYETLASTILDDRLEPDLDELPDNVDTDFIFDGIDYHKFNLDYSKAYADNFKTWFFEETEIDINIEFKELDSPKYYNFTTDRIFCTIDEASIKKLADLCLSDGAFCTYLKDNFTSRDGFISSYSNDVFEWKEKQNDGYEFDHNEIGSFIQFLSDQAGFDYESEHYINQDEYFCAFEYMDKATCDKANALFEQYKVGQ